MTPDEIDTAIDTLRVACDPRGHDLLEVIRVAWKHDATAADLLVGFADALKAAENESHSRNADSRLRVVEDEAPQDILWMRP